jgi:hypothetical protein
MVALTLFAVASLPQSRLEQVLSAGAGHPVTPGYAVRVHQRAFGLGLVALVITAGAIALRRFAAEQQVAQTEEQCDVPPVPLALIGIGTLFRTVLLFGPPHYDEAFTLAEYASRSPLWFLSSYTHSNNHVFHTLLVWLVPGNQLWASRFPAVVAGVGVLFATYFLARRWHGENTARLTVALAAVASPLVEYSAQARGYTLLTLAFLLLFLIEDDRLRAMILALGAWTIPTMVYAAAAWALWFAITQRAWRRLTRVVFVSGALTFLLYLPVLLISGPASITSNGNTLSVPYHVLFDALPRMLLDVGRSWSWSFTIPGAVLIGAAAAMALARGKAHALAATLATIFFLLLVLRKVPFARVWIFVLPLVLIAAASLLAKIRIRTPLLLLATMIVGANALRVTTRPSFVEDPAMRESAEIARTIEQLPADAKVLIMTPLDSTFAFYVPDRIIQDRFDSNPSAVRSAVLAAPRRYALVGHHTGDGKLRALNLPFTRRPVATFEHATLEELR